MHITDKPNYSNVQPSCGKREAWIPESGRRPPAAGLKIVHFGRAAAAPLELLILVVGRTVGFFARPPPQKERPPTQLPGLPEFVRLGRVLNPELEGHETHEAFPRAAKSLGFSVASRKPYTAMSPTRLYTLNSEPLNPYSKRYALKHCNHELHPEPYNF